MTATRTRPLTTLAVVLPAVVVLLGVVAAVAVVLTERHVAATDDEARVRAAAANAVVPVTDALRTALDGTVDGSAPGTRLVTVGQVDDLVRQSAAVLARDTGTAVLDDEGTGLAVAPLYDTPTPPASVAERRAHLTGYRVLPLDLTSTLSRLGPDDGGVVLAGPDGVVSSLPRTAPAGSPSYDVALAPRIAPGWTITLWTAASGTPPGAWLLAVGLVLATMAAAGWLALRGLRAQQTRTELRQLREQTRTVARLASVAQHSLDLAEVLPAVTTELGGALGLRGLTLAAPDPHGERPFFAWGVPPDRESEERGLPETAAAGRTISVPLSRGGRTIARMSVVAGEPLGPHETATLGAVAEILTSVIANAEAFAQQRELLQRMRSVDELKTVFLATASHELRTPVGVITGYAKILASNWDSLTSEQGREYAQRVDSNAQRLRSLVEDLLDFSRLERGLGLDAGHALLDLGEVVSQILDQHPDLAPNHQVTHRTERGLMVRGSRLALERVVTNLVGNAAKYSPAGTTVSVRVRADGARAEIVVDDEGPGVPVAEREQIFSRFYRGSGDAVVNTRGAGLGLAIVSEFVASMGGKVSVGQAAGGGARFVVSYPVAEVDAATFEGETDVAS